MATSTLDRIKTKVRRLTASPSTQQLTDADLEDYINDFYDQDLPASLKLFNLRTNYEFITEANQDTYTLDTDLYYQVEAPIYVAGYETQFFLDQAEFYSKWNKAEVSQTSATGTGGAGPYTWTLGPLRVTKNSLIITANDTSDNQMEIEDDGAGNLVDFGTTTSRGTVNYITGAVSVTFPNAIDTGDAITSMWRPYQAGRPFGILFFGSTLTLRPVPDKAYRVVVQVIRRPSQALATGSDTPQVTQWWQFIAFGAAIKVLQDRQDVESIANIMPFYEEQKQLVLHRTIAQLRQTRAPSIYADQTEYRGNFADNDGGFYL